MKKKKWWIYLIIVVIALVILICLFWGFSNKGTYKQKNITVDNLFVKSFLKSEYLNGMGYTEIKTEDLYGIPLEIRHTIWNISGNYFSFIETPSNSGGGGNFRYGNYVLFITSSNDKFLNADKFPLLGCNRFSFAKENEYQFSVIKTNETLIGLVYGGNPTSPYHEGISDEQLIQLMNNLSSMPKNCTV